MLGLSRNEDKSMRFVTVLGLVVFLSACGADGPPEQPTMDATVGLSGNGGSYGSVGLHQGPISLFFGF
jgi:hypothetical protein